MTGRAVPEWRGATPDQAIPRSVKLRVWAKHGGRCALTGVKIKTGHGQFDHIKPLVLGGEHRESNLQLVAAEPHRLKSAGEVKIKSKADRVRAKHLGIWPEPTRKLQGRGFAPSRRAAP